MTESQEITDPDLRLREHELKLRSDQLVQEFEFRKGQLAVDFAKFGFGGTLPK